MVILALSLVGCASTPRNKWTDPVLRVLLDPDSIGIEDYVRIQNALVNNGRLIVVDRGMGLKAIKKEQDNLHRHDIDRYSDPEKWALYGKLYGVGSVIVAHIQCKRGSSFWNSQNVRINCIQYLAMIHANTGQVLAAVEGEASETISNDMTYLATDWNDTVDALVDKLPKGWEEHFYAGPAAVYRDVAREAALREREKVSGVSHDKPAVPVQAEPVDHVATAIPGKVARIGE